ncbi:MAG: hypothetical protein IJE68_00185 [Clostridia bacterium]|nr:hypothetical protein [Clostridia bacterium]
MGTRISDIESFEKKKAILIKNRELAEQRLLSAIGKYKKIEESDVDRKEDRLRIAKSTIVTKKYVLQQINEQIEFSRPENEEDIAYRQRQYDKFPNLIKTIVPDDVPLRFHGCPINVAQHILEDGEISSSVDRLGISTSYDTEDQVSVTTKYTIETTVRGYAGLVGNFNMPAGCIFVVLPRDEIDAKSGDSMLMNNISFRQSPERLVAVITSLENLQRVSQWAQENDIDISKICEYDEFQNFLEKYIEDQKGKNNKLLASAVKATEESTKMGNINQQALQIKNNQVKDNQNDFKR